MKHLDTSVKHRNVKTFLLTNPLLVTICNTNLGVLVVCEIYFMYVDGSG